MVFVYFQLCAFEFLNRLVLGPLVLSWSSYFVFTTFYKDPEFGVVAPQDAPAAA